MTTIVEIPEGVTIDGGATRGARAALPPPQPATPTNAQKMAALRIPQTAIRLLPMAVSNARKPITESKRSSAKAPRGSSGPPGMGRKRTGADGGNTADPLVVTVTVNGVGAPFARGTVAGT